MAASTEVTWGASSVTIGPQSPITQSPLEIYSVSLTAGGGVVPYQKRSASLNPYVWTMTFEMTAAEKTILQAFYDGVPGPTATFNYTHTDGVTYVARFLNPVLSFNRINSNLWTTTIQLLITPT